MTLRPSSIVAYLRKCNSVVLVHCCNSANVTEPREPHICNIMFSKGAKYTSKSARTDIQFINRITHDDRGRNLGIIRGME
jgi:hypothetical protein